MKKIIIAGIIITALTRSAAAQTDFNFPAGPEEGHISQSPIQVMQGYENSLQEASPLIKEVVVYPTNRKFYYLSTEGESLKKTLLKLADLERAFTPVGTTALLKNSAEDHEVLGVVIGNDTSFVKGEDTLSLLLSKRPKIRDSMTIIKMRIAGMLGDDGPIKTIKLNSQGRVYYCHLDFIGDKIQRIFIMCGQPMPRTFNTIESKTGYGTVQIEPIIPSDTVLNDHFDGSEYRFVTIGSVFLLQAGSKMPETIVVHSVRDADDAADELQFALETLLGFQENNANDDYSSKK